MSSMLAKTLGIAWGVLGLLLMVIGQNLYYDQETWPYSDAGETMYYIGLALVILAVIVFLIGLLLAPSVGEIMKAERLVGKNQDRLRAYRQSQGSDSQGGYWED